MDTVLRKKIPAKTFVATRCTEMQTATQKASALIRKDNLPKDVDLFQILIKASEKEPIKLEIPETLVRDEGTLEPVCLYTDKDGLVRITKGENAQRHFYYLSRERRRSSQKAALHGHHFPKYICFESGKVVSTLNSSSDLKNYLTGKWQRVQRYIASDGFRTQKTVVYWRETKKSKVYKVRSKLGYSGKGGWESIGSSSKLTSATASPCPYSGVKPSFGVYLNYAFVASLSYPHSCEICKEIADPQIAEVVTPLLRRLISTYSLYPDEHLQEFVYSIQKSQDGHWRVLNCARAKVRAVKKPLFLRRSETCGRLKSLKELSSKLFSTKHYMRTTSFGFPKICAKSVDWSTAIQQSLTESPKMKSCPHMSTRSDSLMSHYVSSIAEKFDDLRRNAHVQKEVNAQKNIMKFKQHPPGFLENVISKVYDSIMKDPKLKRYYRNMDQIRGQVESAVRHVIVNGITKSRLREIHRHLYITDFTFDRYVNNFLAALRSQFVKADELVAAQVYFEGFREDIVTVKFEAIDELRLEL